MATKNDKLEVGLWYIVTYANGTRKKFQFMGGEPPKVSVEGEGVFTLAEILRHHVSIKRTSE